MRLEEVVSILRKNETALKQLGAIHLSVFGSTARTQASDASDVDVAVAFPASISGLARLNRLDRLSSRLEQLLGRPVDVVEEVARYSFTAPVMADT